VAVFWTKPHLETAKLQKYEHTNVTIDPGRAHKPGLDTCTPGMFHSSNTAGIRSGAAEAGCVADSTGNPGCQQWHRFHYRASQWSDQSTEATAAKAVRKREAAQVSHEVTASRRASVTAGAVSASIWFGWQRIPSGESPSPFPWLLLPEPVLFSAPESLSRV
jgi:hypothetical protein